MKKVIKQPDVTGQYVYGYCVRGNTKTYVRFMGGPVSLEEATKCWDELNSDDFERISIYRLTKVNPEKL